MKFFAPVWFCLLLIAGSAQAQKAPPDYSQSYAIFIKGMPSGSETVTETTNASGNLVSTSDHEIFVTDSLETKRMAFSTRMVLEKKTWAPISYAYQYTSGNSGDSYEVAVKNGKITRTLNRGGHVSQIEVEAQPNMVILDFNVYHQYDYLVRRYDFKQEGRQIFPDFVPLIGTDIQVALTFLGNANIEFPGGPVAARNFRVEFVGISSGTLSVDKNGRLLRLLIPAQDLEVVRKDLAAAPEAKD